MSNSPANEVKVEAVEKEKNCVLLIVVAIERQKARNVTDEEERSKVSLRKLFEQ